MTLSLQQWHRRYQQQARWTHELRKYIYQRIMIQSASKVLEVGCGTGVIMEELPQITRGEAFGVDIAREPLFISHQLLPVSQFTQGDALYLPFDSGVFTISLCHFLLLWVKDPLQAINEMKRVTTEDGFVLALAEPDYGGRIDYPRELSSIGAWQTQALARQGANPYMGRELRSIFSQTELRNIEVGVLGGQWVNEMQAEDFDLEWEVVNSDLHFMPEFVTAAETYKQLELSSRKAQQRILYVPTFYAIGQV